MIIRRAELRLISLRLRHPFETSFGPISAPKIIVLKLEERGGEVGFGEADVGAGPWYSYETPATAWHVLVDHAIPRLLSKELDSPEHGLRLLDPIRGHPMAKSCIDEALWDLAARLQGRSLANLLGGVRNRVESGVSIGIQKSIEELLAAIDRRLEEGYKRVKVKIRRGWDVNVVQAIRRDYPDIPLMVDANAAYSLDDLPVFEELDRMNLMMIEQPLRYDDLADHAELQQKINTPICLDESIESPADAKAAIKLRSCRIINIKINRVGGLQTSKEIHDLCWRVGMPVWCGSMIETGIGMAHNIALATLPNFTLPNDVMPPALFYEEDVIEPELVLNPDGTINVPKGSGIGVEVLEGKLEKLTRKFWRSSA